MKHAWALVCVLMLFTAAANAQDLSYFGNIKLDSAWHHADSAVADASLPWNGLTDWQTAALTVEADMRLTFPTVLFRVHQDLAFDQEAQFHYRLFEGYASFTPAPGVTVTAGKRHISWGTGYFFFPADKLNPLSLDPSSARRDEGFPGVSVTLSPSANFTAVAAVSFDQSLTHGTDEFFRDFRYGLVLSLLAGPLNMKADLVYQADRVFRPGGGFTLDLAGFILFSEAAVELHNRTLYPSSPLAWAERPLGTPFFSVEAGVRRSFTAGDATLFLAAEYLYAGDGFTTREEDWFFQAVALGAAFFPEHLGNHYLLFSAAFSWEGYFSTEHAVLWNVPDGSLLFSHRLTLLAVENLDMYVEALWSMGGAQTEFGAAGERLRFAAGAICYF
jgi:hypothetical protein